MYENIILNGTFVAAQKTNDHYLVDNLETPRGKINHTVLWCVCFTLLNKVILLECEIL